MKRKLLVLLISINLLFLGCSSKSLNPNTPSTVNSTETNTDSVAERLFYGSLVVGIGAVMLTTVAVVILLLVPKAQANKFNQF